MDEPEALPPPTRPLLDDTSAAVEPSSRDEASIEVQEADPKALADSSTRELRLSQATLKERMGSLNLAISIICPIAILIAISFFSWLWWANRSNPTWRRIILGDYLKQAVPLASLLITYPVASLAALTTSMIASIAIEWHGVPLKHLARVSVVRSANSGQPPTLWNLLFHKDFFKWPPLPLLVLFCWAMVIATQFTSTLLLSDLSQGPVGGVSTYGVNASGLTYSSFYINGQSNPTSPLFSNADYWTDSLSAFETFAEYSQPPPDPAEELDDTGLTLRAFLPIGNQNARGMLQDFKGTASVFDLRVVCARPTVLSLAVCGNTTFSLCGKFALDDSIPGLVGFNGPVGFDCKLPIQIKQSDQVKGVPWDMCFLDTIYGGLISSLDPTNNQTLQHSWDPKLNMSDGPTTEGGWVANNGNSPWAITLGNSYLIINASQPANFRTTSRLNFNSTKSGHWTQVGFSSNTTKLSASVSLSVCFDSLPRPVTLNSSIQEFKVEVANTGTQGIQEPTTIWNTASSRLNTYGLRNQLGATKNRSTSTLQSRGVWSLQGDLVLSEIARLRDTWVVPPKILTGPAFNASTYPWVLQLLLLDMSSMALCPKCSHDGQRQASNTLVQTFNDAIGDTGSPALALQAILTLVVRACYYDWVETFDNRAGGTMTRFQDALVPTRHGGITAVIVIVSVFLLFCGCVARLFFCYTRETLLSDSWQSVVQVVERAEVRSIMQSTGLTTDREVKQWIGKDKQRKRKKYRLGTGISGKEEAVTVVISEEHLQVDPS